MGEHDKVGNWSSCLGTVRLPDSQATPPTGSNTKGRQCRRCKHMNDIHSKLKLGYLLKQGPATCLRRLSNKCRPSYARVGKLLFKVRAERRRINIGGGNWYRPGWENIDCFASYPFADYRIDLRLQQRLPMQDECTELVYSSHCFEHISDEAALFTLRECKRILNPGGVIRIAVPDMDKAFEAYYGGNRRFFEEGGVTCLGETIEEQLVNFFSSYAAGGGPDVTASQVKTKLKELDRHDFCQWCVAQLDSLQHLSHVNAYDFRKLSFFLKSSGFDCIEKSEFRKSSVPALRKGGFDNRPTVTLYIEAKKPACATARNPHHRHGGR